MQNVSVIAGAVWGLCIAFTCCFLTNCSWCVSRDCPHTPQRDGHKQLPFCITHKAEVQDGATPAAPPLSAGACAGANVEPVSVSGGNVTLLGMQLVSASLSQESVNMTEAAEASPSPLLAPAPPAPCALLPAVSPAAPPVALRRGASRRAGGRAAAPVTAVSAPARMTLRARSSAVAAFVAPTARAPRPPPSDPDVPGQVYTVDRIVDSRLFRVRVVQLVLLGCVLAF